MAPLCRLYAPLNRLYGSPFGSYRSNASLEPAVFVFGIQTFRLHLVAHPALSPSLSSRLVDGGPLNEHREVDSARYHRDYSPTPCKHPALMAPLQISYPSVEFKNQLRDGVAPIEACAFNTPRREFLAVDASALRVWSLKRVVKTIMAPSKVRYSPMYANMFLKCSVHVITEARISSSVDSM